VNIRRLSGLLKELKKIFRKRRKLGLSFIFLLIAAVSAVLMQNAPEREEREPVEAIRAKAIAAWSAAEPDHTALESIKRYLRENDVERLVQVYTVYVCGEEKRTYGKLRSRQILDLINEHPGWTADEMSGDTITFYEYVEDLSDSCKQSAYIGIDETGQLKLFEGPPSYEHAIRTFFQIDIEHLKTSLPQEAIDSLYNGIRVRDIEQYRSIIATFKPYALQTDAAEAAASSGGTSDGTGN